MTNKEKFIMLTMLLLIWIVLGAILMTVVESTAPLLFIIVVNLLLGVFVGPHVTRLWVDRDK